MKRPKVLIIGIDGATPDLVLPWCREGKLPNINKLAEEGIYGDLESTVPPITPAAWTSFLTGKNPGKHGIYDFMEREPGSYNFRYINARSRKSPSLWKLLSDHGHRVGVLNVPMTYPPEQLDGFMISGLDAPDEKRAVYPGGLFDELNKNAGGFQLDIRHLGNMKNDDQRSAFLQEVREVEEQRVRVLLYLQEQFQCDFLMLVFNATDQVQHHFWHYMDPSHPKYDPVGSEKFSTAIFDIYQKIDDLIGELNSKLRPTDATILMSDHGFGPTSKYYLSTNHLLEEAGLLTFKNKGLLVNVSSKTEKILKSVLSDNQKKFISNLMPTFREKFENFNLLGALDWKKTKAFAFELTGLAPFIWINDGSSFPSGTVWYEREKTEILKVVREIFENLEDPSDHGKLGTNVFIKSEIFSGPYSSNGPDAVVGSWEETGFNIKRNYTNDDGRSFFGIDNGALLSGTEWSGTHRINGIFLIAGEYVKNTGEMTGAGICDIFPTVLSIFNITLPEGIDGKILKS